MDYNSAKEVFEQYLDGYDRENDKVRLKIVHTYGVVTQSMEIARRMRLPSEDIELARIIALLHDIGRFEQLRRFDSFQPDTSNCSRNGRLRHTPPAPVLPLFQPYAPENLRRREKKRSECANQ